MSAKSSHRLKELESRRTKLKVMQTEHQRSYDESRQTLESTNSKLRSVEADIADLKTKPKEPVVSEHAILRYLERVMGVNINSVTNEILTQEYIAKIKSLKSCKLTTESGVVLIVEDCVVMTVYLNNPDDKLAKKPKHDGPKPAELRHLAREELQLEYTGKALSSSC